MYRANTKCAILCLPLIVLAGCLNPSRQFLKGDYKAYDTYYAQANDEQMLLNLSRLANNDPVYFMQLASINSVYQTTLSGGANASNVRTTPGYFNSAQSVTAGSIPASGANTVSSSVSEFARNASTLGGTLNAGVVETPTFQFVPLTGSNVVNAVMNPIADSVFYTFYDQGYPAELLARLMVRTVRHVTGYTTNSWITNAVIISEPMDVPADFSAFPRSLTELQSKAKVAVRTAEMAWSQSTNFDKPDHTKLTVNLGLPQGSKTNVYWGAETPPAVLFHCVPIVTTNYEYLVNSPGDPSYPEFLRFCRKLGYAQKFQLLSVSKNTSEGSIVFCGTNARLADVVGASQSNLTVRCDTNSGVIMVTKPLSEFHLVKNMSSTYGSNERVRRYFMDDASMGLDDSLYKVVSNSVATLAAGFKANEYSLKMLTVESAMYTAAREERYFREYQTQTGKNRPLYSADDIVWKHETNGPLAKVTYGPGLRSFTFDVWPLLRMTRDGTNETEPPHKLVEISYEFSDRSKGQSKRYFIGDEENDTRNRVVFTLLSYLFEETGVSTQNLPVQQLIHLQ